MDVFLTERASAHGRSVSAQRAFARFAGWALMALALVITHAIGADRALIGGLGTPLTAVLFVVSALRALTWLGRS